jgi:teichuronic acid biosynthesis glycosyltransferase TuaC
VKVLTFTTLYPNRETPGLGVFVENRVARVAAADGVSLRVVAPVARVPFPLRAATRHAARPAVPEREERRGVAVSHPRYPVVPRIGLPAAAALLYAGTRSHVEGLLRDGFEADLLDAHYVYPDGVAAALLARRLGLPLALTARGTDLNLYARLPGLRGMIRWALRRADCAIAVSEALARRAVALGAPAERVRTLRNGVDLERFRILDRERARRDLGLRAPVLGSVGNLWAHKGHGLVIEALKHLPGLQLVVVGEGAERRRFEALASALGVRERVRFLGALPHERMCELYNALDALVLASSREGCPNVVLEAMACGTPVVGTKVGGIPELVTDADCGLLAEERTPEALSDAVRRLLAAPPARERVRVRAERFGWDETVQGVVEVFRGIVAERGATPERRSREARLRGPR